MIRLKSLLFESSENFDLEKFKQGISNIESRGNYQAENPNSSAIGKYQFLWNIWKNKIKNVTGIDNKQDYLDNPDAQEQFMDYVILHDYINAVNKLKKEPGAEKYTDDQLMAMIHFQGLGGARTYLKTGNIANASHNVTMDKYLNVAGMGGSTVRNNTSLSKTKKQIATKSEPSDTLKRLKSNDPLAESLISELDYDRVSDTDDIILSDLDKTLNLLKTNKFFMRDGFGTVISNTWRGFNDIDKFDINEGLQSLIYPENISKLYWDTIKPNEEIFMKLQDISGFKFDENIVIFIKCISTINNKPLTFWIPTSWITTSTRI